MGRVIRSKTARRDAAEIWHYIALQNPRAADHLIDQFDGAIRRISEYPGIGALRDEIAAGLHSYPVGRYLILYRAVSEEIRIARIVHGARDLRKLFED